MRRCLVLIVLLFTYPVFAQSGIGFRAAAGFGLMIYQPDLGPLNSQLNTLSMPAIDKPMVLYGGQIIGQIKNRLRLGIMSYKGSASVEDLANGYARKASFQMGWSGLQVEYCTPVFHGFEAFGGSSFGYGGVDVRLEKTHSPVDWGGIWDQFVAGDPSTQNLSIELHHSFFLVQPRLGLRFYLRDWMAVSGSVELPLLKLNSGGWSVNGSDVNGAPSLDLTSPLFQFSVMVGV